MIYSVSLFQVPLTIRPNFDTIVWSDFFKSWIFSSGLHNGHWVWLVIFGTKKQWHKILEALMVPASGPSRVKSWLIDAVLIKSITLLGGSVRARIRASYFLYGSLPTPLCCSASPPPFNFCGGPWRMYTAARVIVYEYCTVLVLSKLAPVYVVSVLWRHHPPSSTCVQYWSLTLVPAFVRRGSEQRRFDTMWYSSETRSNNYTRWCMPSVFQQSTLNKIWS